MQPCPAVELGTSAERVNVRREGKKGSGEVIPKNIVYVTLDSNISLKFPSLHPTHSDALSLMPPRMSSVSTAFAAHTHCCSFKVQLLSCSLQGDSTNPLAITDLSSPIYTGSTELCESLLQQHTGSSSSIHEMLSFYVIFQC